MNKFVKTIQSSVMKKQIMGVTGLLLCGFLVSHLLGNLLLLVDQGRAFNLYAHALVSNPLIYVAEAILAAIFLSHIGMGIRLTIENKAARPEPYYMKQPTGRGATFASSTMPYTGLIIFIFLIFHILHIKFGPVYMIAYDGVEVRDLYKLMLEYFSSPLTVLWYVFAVVALGIHVSHGFWSAFQSIGFNHPKYNCLLKITAKLYAIAITLGFAYLPIFCFMQGGK